MDYGFSNFETVTLKAQKLPASLPVTGGTKSSVSIKKESGQSIQLLLSAADKITVQENISSSLSAPVRQGDIIGYEEYYLNGELIYQDPVIAKKTVAKRDFGYYQDIFFHMFFFQQNH